jgi:molybdopterin biosynthesis enzyme
MRDSVAFEHVGEALRPGHSAIMSDLHSDPQSASLRAKPSNPVSGWKNLDCFVASLLAMTGGRTKSNECELY